MSTDLVFGETLQILGYHLAADTAALDEELVLTLAWQQDAATEVDPAPLTLFAHLVDSAGQVLAQADLPAQPRPAGLTLTQFRLTPRPGAAPGEFALAIGAYLSADGTPLPDASGNPRPTLTNLTLTPMTMPPFTRQKASRLVVSGRPLLRLVGYDWDHTLPGRTRLYRHWQTEAGYQTEVFDIINEQPPFPAWYGPWGLLREDSTLPTRPEQHYVPLGDGIVWLGPDALAGRQLAPQESLTLSATFAAARPVLRDRIVSVRLVGYEPDGYQWAWWDLHDGVPALGAIPTLKWVRGSVVRDPHPLTVSETATPGQPVGGILRLYDAFTSRPVPILDEDITTDYLGIPLGNATIAE